MSDSEDEYADSELDEIADNAEDDLKSGKLPFTDKGGCYFCPYCAREFTNRQDCISCLNVRVSV